MQNIIYDKTDKGREEIISRRYHLANRLRTLLVMVDGKQTSDDLLAKVAALGLTRENLQELEQEGYVQRLGLSTQFDETIALQDLQDSQSTVHVNGQELFQVLYDFYTENIKQYLGLRGYNLQFVVERANDLQDFRELRTQFLDAVNKTQSPQRANELRTQLDELLSIIPNKIDT